MKIFSETIHSLENAVNRSAVKQKVISQNIANVDTPNYKSKEITFKQSLDSEVSRLQATKTDQRHLSFGSGQESYLIKSKANTSYQANGNNVDVDREMSDLAENQIYYNALIDRLSSKFNSLKTVIRGGS
ncbi:flagellar basal body rod protein FlgB [Metabacillus idriensis]|uniref:flagellar basal body rod protein FlgB n=1 Tax=Metabacillus idriensis TaxID=324768 RepID=UPI0028133AC7|nr:flagellar basal body rod protein FlgB [Metabacillus idriensis]MDR0137360.1 flagellar basal body rod protein FlgB [Metabacillus idriensis]